MNLSIVIPIYNSEAYLNECLESVCTLRETDMEVICVVDGSPDRSADIVREWQERDPRIRLIEQENMGQSGARNTGLREACGDYVWFLDSDDRAADIGTIYACVERMRAEALDMLIATADVFFDPPELEGKVVKNERKYFTIGHDYLGVWAGPELLAALHRNDDWCVSVPAKIFRRRHLTDNRLSFIVGQTHEDEYFSFCCVFLAKRAAVVNVPLFARRVHSDSVMTRAFGRERALGNLINMVEILRFLETQRRERELDMDLAVSVLNSKRNVSDIYLLLDSEERSLFMQSLTPELLFYYTVFVQDELRMKQNEVRLKKRIADLEKITGSRTYRFARALTWPIRFLCRLLRRNG